MRFSIFRIVVFASLFGVALPFVVSQDLGSSNKLFGGTKSTSGTKSVKRPTPTRKPVAAKATTPKKKSTPSKTTAKAATKTDAAAKKPTSGSTAAKSKFTEFQNAKSTRGDAASDAFFERLIQDGNMARDDRNYLAAEAAYRRAMAIKPRDPRGVYGLGNLYSDQQRWDDAEKSYRAALQIDPRDPVAHVALSYVLSQPVAAPDLADRYEEAERLARRAIVLWPQSPLAFDQLGVTLELRGLISAETENAYRRSIQLDSAFAPAYAHLGRLLRRRGLTRESAAAYQSAIQRSVDVGTMILVAEVMQSEQRYAESEQLLRMALAKDPKNPSALLLLGRALTTQRSFAEAEIMLKRCLVVSPDGYMPNSLLGSLYARQGKFELAENALLQALRFVPINEKRLLSQQFASVADGYMTAGKRVNAERSYRQAIALDAENATLVAKLARARGK